MRARILLPLVPALAVACGTPTSPQAESLTGRWEGTFLVTGCTWSGAYTACGPAHEPGSTFLAGLLFLEPSRGSVQGFGQITTFGDDLLRRESMLFGWFEPFAATPGADGTLRFGGGFGRSPAVVHDLEWDLRIASPRRLEGMLVARQQHYRTPGDIVMTGTVVLDKQGGRD